MTHPVWREVRAEPEQQQLGQGRDELATGHRHVDYLQFLGRTTLSGPATLTPTRRAACPRWQRPYAGGFSEASPCWHRSCCCCAFCCCRCWCGLRRMALSALHAIRTCCGSSKRPIAAWEVNNSIAAREAALGLSLLRLLRRLLLPRLLLCLVLRLLPVLLLRLLPLLPLL
jgi:hypothetical protein